MKTNISLIIPAYNEEKYIGSCIEHAIRNGGNLLYEIIVVNNMSTDKTREIAESYKTQFINLRVVTETKKGVTRARECGFRESEGGILAYIDADTQMPEGWVEQIIKTFKQEEVSFLSGPYDYYDLEKVQRICSILYWKFLAYPLYIFIGYIGVGGNFAIRRDVLEKMGGFDTTIEFYGDDTNTARRAKEFGRVIFSLKFIMPTSGRRFGQQGTINTTITYALNFFSEAIFHKTYTKKYKDYR